MTIALSYGTACSGIEAPSVAWQPLGWRAAWFSEIEPFCCALLKQRYPDVPNLGDATAPLDAEPVDVFVAGFPCQDLSLAGGRKGLVDDETGLPTRSGLLFLPWLDSPIDSLNDGLFSRTDSCPQSRGETLLWWLERYLGSHATYQPEDGETPAWSRDRSGWSNGAYWTHSMCEWTATSEPFRSSVFLVRDSGDWRSRSPVLLERVCLRRNPPPRRTAGEEIAGSVAPSIGATGRGFSRADSRGQDCTVLTRDVAMALNAGGQGRDDSESQTFVVFDTTQITSAGNANVTRN